MGHDLTLRPQRNISGSAATSRCLEFCPTVRDNLRERGPLLFAQSGTAAQHNILVVADKKNSECDDWPMSAWQTFWRVEIIYVCLSHRPLWWGGVMNYTLEWILQGYARTARDSSHFPWILRPRLLCGWTASGGVLTLKVLNGKSCLSLLLRNLGLKLQRLTALRRRRFASYFENVHALGSPFRLMCSVWIAPNGIDIA